MSYFSDPAELKASGIIDEGFSDVGMPRGCEDATEEYGKTEGIPALEVGYASQAIQRIDPAEYDDRIEFNERGHSTLMHRIDADWERAMTQGRLGYCWSYAVIGAIDAEEARDGKMKGPYSAASVAAQIKNGRDQGGWPVEAAKWIKENGVCKRSSWGDCNCKGNSCKGVRGGCQARDLSLVEKTKAEAAEKKITNFYELSRNDFEATASAILQGFPVAAGWVGTGAWCDGHAMLLTRMIKTSRNGYQFVPENSWGNFKRRTPVSQAPRGGVVLVNTTQGGVK